MQCPKCQFENAGMASEFLRKVRSDIRENFAHNCKFANPPTEYEVLREVWL